MSVHTTNAAIKIAIESIQIRPDLTEKTKENAVHLLENLLNRDWYGKWDKESIVAALMAYKEEHGVAPTTTNLKEFGMPKTLTIETYFGVKASAFLKHLFPENRNDRRKKPTNDFGFTTKEQWLSCFVEQFDKHKGDSIDSKTYDQRRDYGTPSWSTIARYCGLSRWTDLIEMSGVKRPKKKTKNAEHIYIKDATSPLVEKLERLVQRREELNAEFFEMLGRRNA